MLSRAINLAIVDDHVLFRKTLTNYLSDRGNFQIMFQASNGAEMLTKLQVSHPDVIILDIFIPDLNGIEAIRNIRQQYPGLKILILSMSDDLELISDLMDAGINGYISKADDPDELLQAIYAAADGRICRTALFTEALYWNKESNISQLPESRSIQMPLNDREKRILQLIWEEKSNKEMADELFLGVRSVEKIRQDMKEKVGVKSTIGLIKYAISKRLIVFNAKIAG